MRFKAVCWLHKVGLSYLDTDVTDDVLLRKLGRDVVAMLKRRVKAVESRVPGSWRGDSDEESVRVSSGDESDRE